MKTDQLFISFLSDYGFKVTFADETDTLFLRKALQALIQSEHAIRKVHFARNENAGITHDSRGSLYDLICVDEKGNNFIVEMQRGYYEHFIHRSKFYAFQRLNILIDKGTYKFDNLPPIYCIGLLAKSIYPKSNHYYHFGRLKNQAGELMDHQITHVIVELDKFDKTAHEIESDLEKLIYTMKNLKHINDKTKAPDFLDEEWLKSAIKKLETTAMTAEEREQYSHMLAANGTELYMREQIWEKGIQKGREEERKLAKDRTLEQAKKMKEKGLSFDDIEELTGLTRDEIERL